MHKKIIFFILLINIAQSQGNEPLFKGDFQGLYAGLSGSIEKTRLFVNNQLFSGRNVSLGPTIGGGFTFKDFYYMGLEGTVVHNEGHFRKPAEKLDKKNTYTMMVRLGKIIRNNFLPYLSLGPGTTYYTYTSPLQKTSLRLKTIHSSLGVDAFVRENFLIRSSLRYTITTSLHKDNSAMLTGKKPRTFSIEIGVFYKFKGLG